MNRTTIILIIAAVILAISAFLAGVHHHGPQIVTTVAARDSISVDSLKATIEPVYRDVVRWRTVTRIVPMVDTVTDYANTDALMATIDSLILEGYELDNVVATCDTMLGAWRVWMQYGYRNREFALELQNIQSDTLTYVAPEKTFWESIDWITAGAGALAAIIAYIIK